MIREDEHIKGRALEMRVEVVRGRGRPKRRWSDDVTEDMTEKNPAGADVRDRRKWRKEVVNVYPYSSGKRQREGTEETVIPESSVRGC